MVMVLPDPDVVEPAPPRTFKTFAAGTAVPLSVTKLVGIVGLTGPAVVLIIPAWLIIHLP